MTDFITHSNRLLTKIDRKFTVYLLINGKIIAGVLNTPQSEATFKSASKGGSQLSRPINQPELKLNKQAGQFNQGDPVHFLCKPHYPDCKMDKFSFNETDAYHVTLIRTHTDNTTPPQDNKKWQ